MTSKTQTKPPKKLAESCNTTRYLSIKLASAPKSGQRTRGQLHYRVLTDSNRGDLFLMIVGNDDNGYHSKEAVAFSKIEKCLILLCQIHSRAT